MWLDHLRRDVRHALLQIRRGPVSTAIVILSLALGIGFNTGIFSLADQALVRALPVVQPGQLVLLDWHGAFIGGGVGTDNLFSIRLSRAAPGDPRLHRRFRPLPNRCPPDGRTGDGGGRGGARLRLLLPDPRRAARGGPAPGARRTISTPTPIPSSSSLTTIGRTASALTRGSSASTFLSTASP